MPIAPGQKTVQVRAVVLGPIDPLAPSFPNHMLPGVVRRSYPCILQNGDTPNNHGIIVLRTILWIVDLLYVIVAVVAAVVTAVLHVLVVVLLAVLVFVDVVFGDIAVLLICFRAL